jgi:EAL domain-containing protein (putative c-di-GMP-specific phosphodiesterase class I)
MEVEMKNIIKQLYINLNVEKALKKCWIMPAFQPIYSATTGELYGMEMLSRWIDPLYGVIYPSEFISVIKEKGLIKVFDLYMLEYLYISQQLLDIHGIRNIVLSYNVSAEALDGQDAFFRTELERITKKRKGNRSSIRIEVNEAAMTSKAMNQLSRSIREMSDSGYHVWLDNFGSGYTAIDTLRCADFRIIKIDMGSIEDCDERSMIFLKAIVKMADFYRIKTLVKGIETEEQYNFVTRCGVNYVQGFYLGKPSSIRSYLKKSA